MEECPVCHKVVSFKYIILIMILSKNVKNFDLDAVQELSVASHQDTYWRKSSQMQRMRESKKNLFVLKNY